MLRFSRKNKYKFFIEKCRQTIGVVVLYYCKRNAVVAQQGEHIPYKDRVIGSSPINCIIGA